MCVAVDELKFWRIKEKNVENELNKVSRQFTPNYVKRQSQLTELVSSV